MNYIDITDLTPIGEIGVDSGQVFIGDPCYTLPDDSSSRDLVKSWHDFCELLDKTQRDGLQVTQLDNSVGVCTATRHGDGVYTVYGLIDEKSGRPRAIVIDFDGIVDNGDFYE